MSFVKVPMSSNVAPLLGDTCILAATLNALLFSYYPLLKRPHSIISSIPYSSMMRRPSMCRCKMVVVIFSKAFSYWKIHAKPLFNTFSDTDLDIDMTAEIDDVSFVPRERAEERIPGRRVLFKSFFLSNEARRSFFEVLSLSSWFYVWSQLTMMWSGKIWRVLSFYLLALCLKRHP